MVVKLAVCLVALFLGIAGAVDIRTSCTTIYPVYNVATGKNAYFHCNLSVIDIPNYVFAATFFNLGPPGSYDDWINPINSNCRVSYEDYIFGPKNATNCTYEIASTEERRGLYEFTVQYFHKYSGGVPGYIKSLANITIVSDPTFTCSPGYAYQGNSYCEKCPKGTYSTGTACIACPLGTDGTAVGAASCAACPPGYYGNGNAACTVAPAGWYAPGGTYRSYSCGPGTYSAIAASSCSTCPAGTFSCANAASCTACSAGRTSEAGSSFCIPCAPGTYAPAGSATCTNCPADTYSPTLAATSSATCKTCPAGKSLQPGCVHSPFCCV